MSEAKRPGGPIATRPLHFFWVIDCSGSMSQDGKIQAVNNAAREALPHMRSAAEENPNAQVFIRILRFGSTPDWATREAEELESFQWPSLEADLGLTSFDRALAELETHFHSPPMPDRQLPPVVVLMSDGMNTDPYQKELRSFLNTPWGGRSVRVAIAIGRDANRATLQDFINNPEIIPLEANNPEALVRFIRWASTEPLKAASSGAAPAGAQTQPNANVVLPPPPAATNTGSDVW